MYTASYSLPKLNKKIIYLDQFVISDMMKAINENIGKTKKVNSFFLEAFSQLDSLVKAQLLICPDSEFHRQESMISNVFKALKRMYEHLSNGTTLYDPATIRRFQIDDGFKKWIKNNHAPLATFDVDLILHGDRNEWQNKFLISIDSKISPKEIEDYKNSRLKVHEEVKKLFDEWRKSKISFNEYYNQEASYFGPSLMRKYFEAIIKLAFAKISGKEISTEEQIALVMSDVSTLITDLIFYLSDKLSDEEKYKKISLYLSSDDFKKLPFNVISSALWAAIEYQASTGGRTTPPNIGMFNDIEMVSTLLPYCDAMFIDKDMFSILNFGEVKKIIQPYKTKVFSLSNEKNFFSYLEDIKSKASKAHFELLGKVYGSNWDKPYYEMYDFEP
jgi:hypothetical protein